VLERLRARLEKFEKQYGVSYGEFVERFKCKRLGGDEGFFKWHTIREGMEHWEHETEELMSAFRSHEEDSVIRPEHK